MDFEFNEIFINSYVSLLHIDILIFFIAEYSKKELVKNREHIISNIFNQRRKVIITSYAVYRHKYTHIIIHALLLGYKVVRVFIMGTSVLNLLVLLIRTGEYSIYHHVRSELFITFVYCTKNIYSCYHKTL